MIPLGHWRRLLDEDLVRRPRLAEPAPADLAAIWLQLSDERKVQATLRAQALGLEVFELIDARMRQLQGLLKAARGTVNA